MRVFLLAFLFLLLPKISFAQADTSKCVGPYTITATESKNWDFSKIGGCDQGTFAVKLNSGTFLGQLWASLDTTTGDAIPKDLMGTTLPAVSASGWQQFTGPWMFVRFNVSALAGSITYNICCKSL